ncbi:ATS1 [Candida jiufengensis]|uniref:ATS1 n=1 Tax=Candida jiufengensis TaxID=497108 RepID=UPI00222414CA|nr:ATS1 [Candida jiufengensis]KAI5957166.1 ATS1 [Candida jiufengensis]
MYQILSCGSNGQYQLGQGNDEDQFTLRTCEFLQDKEISTTIYSKPLKISCGGNHTLILLEDGDVYSCGNNEYKQICQEDKVQSIFKKIEFEKKIRNISCCWDSSFLVTEYNEVYSCGQGLKGELGLGLQTTSEPELKLVKKFDHNVIDIKCGMNHVIVKLDNAQLYGWGNCRKGQLGETSKKLIKRGSIWEPVLLQMQPVAVEDFLEVGREFTIITSNGQPYVYGKFSDDGLQNQMKDMKDIGQIKTMWASIHFKEVSSNSIKSFGVDSHGQLFKYNIPESDSKGFKFEVGSEHGLLQQNNKLYAWGWGEHGNCGPSLTGNPNTFNYLNQLFPNKEFFDGKIVYFTGGCATSWVCIEL